MDKEEDKDEGPEDEEAERRREEKGKAVIKEEDLISVKARLSDRGGPDLVLSIGKDQTVRSLVRKIQEEANVSFSFCFLIGYDPPHPVC